MQDLVDGVRGGDKAAVARALNLVEDRRPSARADTSTLLEALGENVPTFAHLPLILGPDRKRLSKRHGAVSVLAYRDEGYLPEAMFNFLALLGWSPGDDEEKMDRQTLIERFSLDGVGRSGAIFDLKKLDWLNGEYLAEMGADLLAPLARPGLEGTMARRLHDVGEFMVAKTGTLSGHSALAGMLQDPSGARPIGFAILVDGARTSEARRVQDSVARALHRHLEASADPP